MQALILAAGRGTRLGAKGEGVPKCLLEVARRPLIEHQLAALASAGVGPVAMVVGYSADEIRESVGMQVEYILNPQWSNTNSLYSFWLARDWIQGDLVVLNCDLLFDPAILDRLLAKPGDAIAYDSASGDGREHMKVQVHQGFLRDMRKDLEAQLAAGENVGILKFTAETGRALVAKAGELVDRGDKTQWLGAAVREIARERDIRVVDIAGLPWAEVDFSYDLERARKEVWPAIVRSQRRRRPWWRFGRWAALVLALAVVAWALSTRWGAQEAAMWSMLDLNGVPWVSLSTGARQQRWGTLKLGETTATRMAGPGPLRIDSRLVWPQEDADLLSYVLEVTLDGQRVDWFKFTVRASLTARLGGRQVGKHRGVEVEIPEGDHTVEIRLVAADSELCLVRVRALDTETLDFEEAEDLEDEEP